MGVCHCLNETAFILRSGQYGRIIWNERRTDYDNRTWYYQLHILNLFHMPLGQEITKDIFLAAQPDFEYKQLAVLSHSSNLCGTGESLNFDNPDCAPGDRASRCGAHLRDKIAVDKEKLTEKAPAQTAPEPFSL